MGSLIADQATAFDRRVSGEGAYSERERLKEEEFALHVILPMLACCSAMPAVDVYGVVSWTCGSHVKVRSIYARSSAKGAE